MVSDKKKEYQRQYIRKWYLENREEHKKKNQKWYLENKHRYNIGRVQMRQRYRDILFEILGGAVCVKCGFSDRRALQFDHKMGEGTRKMHNEEMKDYHNYVKYARNPELARKTFQVLCANCNAIKRHEYYKAPLNQIIT